MLHKEVEDFLPLGVLPRKLQAALVLRRGRVVIGVGRLQFGVMSAMWLSMAESYKVGTREI